MMQSSDFILFAKKFNSLELVEELVSIYAQKLTSKNIKIDCREVESIEWVSDPNRLRGLLSILIENAIKFTLEGEIKIKAMTKDQGKSLYFSVQDTGVGISQEDQINIEKMIAHPIGIVKTENSTGLGLGLKIAQGLVHILSYKKSQMTISSSIEKGTKISFRIKMLSRNNVISKHVTGLDNVVSKVKYFLDDPTSENQTNIRSVHSSLISEPDSDDEKKFEEELIMNLE